MSSESEKPRLRLGDLIRRINEAPEGEAPLQSTRSAQPLPPENEPRREIQPPLENAQLPPQPALGRPRSAAAPALQTPPQPLTYATPAVQAPPAPPAQSSPEPSSIRHDAYRPPHPSPVSTIPAAAPPTPTPAAAPSAPHTMLKKNDDDEEAFDVMVYIGILYRRWPIIAAIAIVAFLYSLYGFLTAPTFFVANARLLFKPESDQLINSNSWDMYADRAKNFNTHLELLKSNGVLSIVSGKLDSVISADQISAGLTISPGKTNSELNDIIELSMKHSDPAICRDALNELCKTYIDYRHEINSQEETRLLFKLKSQIEKLQQDLTSKEDDLRSFKEANKMVELSQNAVQLSGRVASTETAIKETELALTEGERKLSAIKSQIGMQQAEIEFSTSYSNPLRNKLTELELEMSTISGEYSADHYRVKNLQLQIDQIKKAMLTDANKEASTGRTVGKNPIRQNLAEGIVTLNVELSTQQAKRDALKQYLTQLDAEMQHLPAIEQRYAFLERETQSILSTLEMLKMKYEEVKVRRDAKETDIKILELTETPTNPISSRKIATLIAALLIGIIAGTALALLIEYIDQTVKDPYLVEKQANIPILGLVPQIDDQSVIITTGNLDHIILEPLRKLRTSISHLMQQNNSKVIMLCSAVKGEGKTTLAANLSITFALDRKRIVIIDCDMRRSQLHHVFNISKEKGLSDYLSGRSPLRDIIKQVGSNGLHVVTAGVRPDNPAELLNGPVFLQLLNELRPLYDIIICDSPAIMPVSDTLHIARHMDMSFMVARMHWTPFKALLQTKNQLTMLGVNLAGCILNGLSQHRGYYPYYYGYYGYYPYRYSYDYDKEPSPTFSMRHFGLAVDEAVRSVLKTIATSMPAVSAMVRMIIIKRIILRPSFIIILMFLCAAIYARKYIDSKLAIAPRKEIITRVDSSDIPRAIAVAPTSADVNTVIEDTIVPCGLNDTLNHMLAALNRHDALRLLSFYDDSLFSFPGGGIAEWKKELESNFILDAQISYSIDSSNGTLMNDTLLAATETYLSIHNGNRLSNVRVSRIWNLRNGSWRVIREKETGEY